MKLMKMLFILGVTSLSLTPLFAQNADQDQQTRAVQLLRKTIAEEENRATRESRMIGVPYWHVKVAEPSPADSERDRKARETLRRKIAEEERAAANATRMLPTPATASTPVTAPKQPAQVKVAEPSPADSERDQKARETLRHKIAEEERAAANATRVLPAPATASTPVTAPKQPAQVTPSVQPSAKTPGANVKPIDAAAKAREEQLKNDAEKQAREERIRRIEAEVKRTEEEKRVVEAQRKARVEAEKKAQLATTENAAAKVEPAIPAPVQTSVAPAKPPPALTAVTSPSPEPKTSETSRQNAGEKPKPGLSQLQKAAPVSPASQEKQVSQSPGSAAPSQPATAPLPRTKEQRLSALLEVYKADLITPVEYHQQRAKILAEP